MKEGKSESRNENWKLHQSVYARRAAGQQILADPCRFCRFPFVCLKHLFFSDIFFSQNSWKCTTITNIWDPKLVILCEKRIGEYPTTKEELLKICKLWYVLWAHWSWEFLGLSQDFGHATAVDWGLEIRFAGKTNSKHLLFWWNRFTSQRNCSATTVVSGWIWHSCFTAVSPQIYWWHKWRCWPWKQPGNVQRKQVSRDGRMWKWFRDIPAVPLLSATHV